MALAIITIDVWFMLNKWYQKKKQIMCRLKRNPENISI